MNWKCASEWIKFSKFSVIFFIVSISFMYSKNPVALVHFSSKGSTPVEIEKAKQIFLSALFNSRIHEPISLTNLSDSIIDMNKVIDAETAYQAGRVFNVKTVLFGTLIKLKSAYIYDIRVMDVPSEKQIASLQAKAGNFDFLLEAATKIVNDLDEVTGGSIPSFFPSTKEKTVIPNVESRSNDMENETTMEPYPSILRNNKKAFIIEVKKDKAILDIGEYHKVKKRMLYEVYAGGKKIKRGEIREVGIDTSVADFKGSIDESYVNNPNVYGKLIGHRWVFGFGPSPGIGKSSDGKETVLSFSLALHLYTRIGLGFEWDLGVYNTFSNHSKRGGYKSLGEKSFEDYLFAPLFITYHFFQKTYFSPYLGVGVGFRRSVKKEYIGRLRIGSNAGGYQITKKSAFVPVAVVGVNILKIRRVNINLNFKAFPLDGWGGERADEKRLLAFVFSPGVIFNF